MNYAHWYYFLTLVEDLENSTRYVEVDKANYKTFSVEFTRIILSACSEIDVVSKILCSSTDATGQYENIRDYERILVKEFPKLSTAEIALRRYGIKIIPWESWASKKVPDWWTWHNQIKHQRDKFFQDANLECALYAVAGLAVMVSYLYVNELVEHKLTSIPDFLFLSSRADQSYGTISRARPLVCPPDYDPPGFGRNATPLKKR